MPARPPAPHPPPSISDAEWHVMEEFWQRGEATSAEIVEALAERQQWKPPTVMTLITRLVKKGALGFTKQGREHLYRPLVDEARCKHAVSKSFIDRVFGGRVAPLLASFIDRRKLSKKDIQELRQLLNEETGK